MIEKLTTEIVNVCVVILAAGFCLSGAIIALGVVIRLLRWAIHP